MSAISADQYWAVWSWQASKLHKALHLTHASPTASPGIRAHVSSTGAGSRSSYTALSPISITIYFKPILIRPAWFTWEEDDGGKRGRCGASILTDPNLTLWFRIMTGLTWRLWPPSKAITIMLFAKPLDVRFTVGHGGIFDFLRTRVVLRMRWW